MENGKSFGEMSLEEQRDYICGREGEFTGQADKYGTVVRRYEALGNELISILQAAAKSRAPMALVQARAKQLSSFVGKIARSPHLKDHVTELTDLCGARVVVHTRSEVDRMCQYIQDEHRKAERGEGGVLRIDWDRSQPDPLSRHGTSEFGYSSAHFIVQLCPPKALTKSASGGTDGLSGFYPDEAAPMKAEIQIRTLLEHAWSDFTHDRVYKAKFQVPDKWERQLSAIAAQFEQNDQDFERIAEGLVEYEANYGVYLSRSEMIADLQSQKVVLKYDDGNLEIVSRISGLAICLERWDDAIDALQPYVEGDRAKKVKRDEDKAALQRELGIALCGKGEQDRQCGDFTAGQKHLVEAAAEKYGDARAMAALAHTLVYDDLDRACRLYEQAYKAEPTNAEYLGSYLELLIVQQGNIHVVSPLIPAIERALQRSRSQAEVGMNLPWAYFSIGKLKLLQGQTYDAFSAYAKGIQVSSASHMIKSAIESIERLGVIEESLPAYGWIQPLLAAGIVAHFDGLLDDAIASNTQADIDRCQLAADAARQKYIVERNLKTLNVKIIKGPVVMVVGGAGVNSHEMSAYEPILDEAFKDYKGTVISGATKSGIPGIVGSISKKRKNVYAVGYLPSSKLPQGVEEDARYSEIRKIVGKDFTPAQPLKAWIDVLASGIRPSQVRVLGINGGDISASEYRMALAFGAWVGVIIDTGREAAKLFADSDWRDVPSLVRLPYDNLTVRAFIRSSGYARIEDIVKRDTLGRKIYERYHESQADKMRNESAKWDDVAESYKESNRQQADDIEEKLRAIKCEIASVPENCEATILKFSPAEIETMAKLEHARWNVERLLAGWKYGKDKDASKKISPYLVPWDDLAPSIQDLDRETVAAIPLYLADVNCEVRRLAASK